MAENTEGDGEPKGVSGQNDPSKGQTDPEPKGQTVDDFKTKYEAAEAARLVAEKKLAEATKGRMTDAERIAALETNLSEFTDKYETLTANFGALKNTYETEQAEKKALLDQERTDLIARLKESRPGLDEKNLSKCDLLFLRDLAKNVAPPSPSAVEPRQQTFQAAREKNIAELREQRRAKNKR